MQLVFLYNRLWQKEHRINNQTRQDHFVYPPMLSKHWIQDPTRKNHESSNPTGDFMGVPWGQPIERRWVGNWQTKLWEQDVYITAQA